MVCMSAWRLSGKVSPALLKSKLDIFGGLFGMCFWRVAGAVDVCMSVWPVVIGNRVCRGVGKSDVFGTCGGWSRFLRLL